jgi:transcriptional regulator with XRE-family HTH domain
MGQKLKELRTAALMTQQELAKAARVGLGTIRNWEQDRRVPLLTIAARVADALGVSLDEMIERSPPPADAAQKPRGRPRKKI